ncbi:ubiquinone anaerobic biosynthesis accessory factor UbiT [Erwinia psidii]|uniref:Ubiquinone biosynthesis accessory factor UbiT n=1 Tax=Erwinia psidii TaxID=69224 RepID=A0A3N6S8E6_9GAMM|nr:SCP2 domain-containing protein [Erwinia psidii]MCX8958517.1 SCP2 domain-containing protein [Erwinia psidii]MCX8962021.1 SCP2 domain-containing protein [Erwinia psidii]MCX8965649.1 SCP2 domain-containing protein [Erwinia psidii]RQM37430.1 SCP2 domain-containing protein [Erwinia psidii]
MLNQLRAQLVRKGPFFLRFPLSCTPFAVKRYGLQQLLSWHFHHVLAEGELHFLEGRWLGIEIRDLGLCWATTVEQGRLRVEARKEADVWFRGDANDFLLVAARRLDPDTLFFQRRLVIEGDTELGLEVKNLMDAIDVEFIPVLMRTGLMQFADLIEAGLTEDATSQVDRAGASC